MDHQNGSTNVVKIKNVRFDGFSAMWGRNTIRFFSSRNIDNPYIKVTGSVSVCPKDHSNPSAEMVHLYNVASHRPWEGL